MSIPLWQKFAGVAEQFGHGGSDYITLNQFIRAVRNVHSLSRMFTTPQRGAPSGPFPSSQWHKAAVQSNFRISRGACGSHDRRCL